MPRSVMPAKKAKTTRWAPVMWQRQYRDVAIWVEDVYTTGPTWEWNTEHGNGGRARTKTAAMKAAQKYVDAALKGDG